MDRDKLAEFRKKKAADKAAKHQELLDSNASVKEAVLQLSKIVSDAEYFDIKVFTEQMESLRNSVTFGKEVEALDQSLAAIHSEMLTSDDVQKILDSLDSINNTDVVAAVNNLVSKIEDQTTSQSPEDFQPVRRVRKIGNRFVFDDDPSQNIVGGGGGGGGIQRTLIEDNRVKVTLDGASITVDNVGLENIAGDKINPATEGKQDDLIDAIENISVSVDTTGLATDARQDAQTALLTTIESNQQTDGLTDTQLRATPIDVDTGLTVQTDALTDEELRAAPIETTTAVVTERYDYATDPVYYVGTAPPGSATSAAVWTINKYDLTDESNAEGKIATNAVWEDRLTETYS